MNQNPLSKADRTSIAKWIYELKINEEAIERAGRAGIDVAELHARNQHVIGGLQALLDEYGADGNG